jgi:hypothetical protein
MNLLQISSRELVRQRRANSPSGVSVIGGPNRVLMRRVNYSQGPFNSMRWNHNCASSKRWNNAYDTLLWSGVRRTWK